VHEAESHMLKTPPEPAHQFTVTLEADVFTEEKYALFENYQRIVHQEPESKISPHGFRRFLCDSPLRRETFRDETGRERPLGSFHQCYRLDGKLVAIGVLDLLPDCVSAVYFLYHESVHGYSLGKVGAVREITLALEHGYRWWYSGYYIHSCPKMRYKIDYSPQYVLDPETLTWDLLDKEALAIFDKKHYVSLSRERRGGIGDAGNGNAAGDAMEVESGPQHNSGGGADGLEGESEGADEEDVFLLTSNMPGIMSLEGVAEMDLDSIPLRTDVQDGIFHAADLAAWASESISDAGSLKSKIAELVAVIGPDLMGEWCLDFRRHRS